MGQLLDGKCPKDIIKELPAFAYSIHLVSEGSQDMHVHNALGKSIISVLPSTVGVERMTLHLLLVSVTMHMIMSLTKIQFKLQSRHNIFCCCDTVCQPLYPFFDGTCSCLRI